MGLWATWASGRGQGYNEMSFKVSSNTNSGILWSTKEQSLISHGSMLYLNCSYLSWKEAWMSLFYPDTTVNKISK